MKKYLLSLLWWWLAAASQAQLGDILKRRAGEGARQGAASGTEKAMDKSLDRLFHKNKTTVSADSVDTVRQDEPIPATLTFDWQVIQRTGGEDGEQEVTYYFTTSGDYAALKPQDKSFSLMVYSRQGHTWMFDDKTKTIMVMNMPRVVGEGGLAAKQMAEHFKKGPLEKDKNDEHLSVRKTGRTREIAGYTADEYEMTNTRASSGRTGAASFWYAKVPFDPVKIYTMGAGRPADPDKLRNDPKMKNNIIAIPVLNTNYLWVETEAGGKKGLQTLSIKKSPVTINTSGYTIKSLHH
ncbi:MAG: hypothetical protein J0H74_35020 [Chitinophagaceae bacterium]|nr:hypothetical protein [Chitinophagaceae bacterium]